MLVNNSIGSSSLTNRATENIVLTYFHSGGRSNVLVFRLNPPLSLPSVLHELSKRGAMVLVRHTDFKSAVPVCKTGRRFNSPCPLHRVVSCREKRELKTGG
jgi:hypothetical protein